MLCRLDQDLHSKQRSTIDPIYVKRTPSCLDPVMHFCTKESFNAPVRSKSVESDSNRRIKKKATGLKRGYRKCAKALQYAVIT